MYVESPGGRLKTWKTSNICKLPLFCLFCFWAQALDLEKMWQYLCSVSSPFSSLFVQSTQGGKHDETCPETKSIDCKSGRQLMLPDCSLSKNVSAAYGKYINEKSPFVWSPVLMCLEVLTWRQSWEQIFEVCVASHFVSHLHHNPLASAVVSVLSVLTLSYGWVWFPHLDFRGPTCSALTSRQNLKIEKGMFNLLYINLDVMFCAVSH